MAVNEITTTTTTPPLPPSVQGPVRSAAQFSDPVPPSPVAPSAPVAPAAAVATTADLTPAQEAALSLNLSINQTLADLNFLRPPARPDIGTINATNPLLIEINEREGLAPAQQVALAINDSLFNLSPPPSVLANPLLIDETNPILDTIEAVEDLNVVQQGEVVVNETLQNLGVTPPVLTLAEATAAATATVQVPQALTLLGGAQPTTLPLGATPGTGTVATTAGLDLLLATTTPATIATPVTTTPPPTTAAVTVTPPLLSATATEPRDPTPFAFAVYEVRAQHPAPVDPTPIIRDILPPLPLGRVRPVDRLILKRAWGARKEGEREEGIQEETPPAEKSLRHMVDQANTDLATNGLPLHLALTKNDEEYVLEVYDCSDGDKCRMEQEIPLDLAKLGTILDNIQHETGIIIDIRT